MSNSHRGPAIDASYHVSVYLAKLFQNRRFLEIDQSSSEAAWLNDMKLGKEHLWRVLYRDCSFRFDPLANMATTGNS
jgi:hypothetical protein